MELNPSPKYPHTNSPDWFPYFSLENKLRDFAKKKTKQFPFGENLNKFSWLFFSMMHWYFWKKIDGKYVFFSVCVLGGSEEKSRREGGCSMPANPFIALNSDYNMVTYFHGTWFFAIFGPESERLGHIVLYSRHQGSIPWACNWNKRSLYLLWRPGIVMWRTYLEFSLRTMRQTKNGFESSV